MSIESDLNRLGITYSDIEDDLYNIFPKDVFNSQLEIEELDFFVPDNTFFEYAIYEIPNLKEIESIPEGVYGKDLLPVPGWDSVRDSQVLDGSLPSFLPAYLPGISGTNYLPATLAAYLGDSPDQDAIDLETSDTIYRSATFSIHGNNILFETDDTSRHVKLETKVTNKRVENIEKDLRFDIMSAYYYLYRGNIDEVYSYVRLISTAVDNIRNQKHRNLQERKIPVDRKVTPWQL